MIHHPVVKASLEMSSVGAIVGWWIGVLPTVLGMIATSLSIAWYIYSFYKECKK